MGEGGVQITREGHRQHKLPPLIILCRVGFRGRAEKVQERKAQLLTFPVPLLKARRVCQIPVHSLRVCPMPILFSQCALWVGPDAQCVRPIGRPSGLPSAARTWDEP